MALINVVFLLLLFFVVTGTIVYQHDRSIEPPTSVMLSPGRAPADAVYIDAEGTLRFRGNPQGAAEIARTLLAGTGETEEGQSAARTVQIVADHRLKARSLLAIIEELRGHGLHSLSIVTVRDSAR